MRPGGFRVLAGIAIVVALAAPLLSSSVPSPARAAEGDTVVLVRILGPADQATFRDTGEYRTVWSGEVTVPREVTVTASSGKQYRLFVEGGWYQATRLSDGQTWDLDEADDALGATSVLAALHQASLQGGFEYRLSDAYFPDPGFFLSGVDGCNGSGSVGWSYRVWSGESAPCPSASIDRFLLGYDSMSPPAPHPQVVFFWGYGTDCRVLRVVPEVETIECGEPVQVTVECFADSGYSGEGTWEPVADARVCTGDECRLTGDDGSVGLVFDQSGTFALTASAGHDGEYYYIPSDDSASVNVEGECRVISFTIVDHGEAGLDFGLAMRGTADQPEAAQTAEHGAVTLVVGPETTVDCDLKVRVDGDIEALGGAVLPADAFSWSVEPSASAATPMTADYIVVGTAPALSSTELEVWHWLSVPEDQAPAAYSGSFCYCAVPGDA